VLTLTDSTGTQSISFSGNEPVNISAALLDAQQGTGNSVFDIRLDAAQQAQYDAFVSQFGASNVFASLSASFGEGLPGQICPTGGPLGAPAGCFGSTDGQETFLAFHVVPGPIAGAGLWPIMAAGLGLLGFNRFRRRRTA
jgi:hypothetical protein